MMRFVPLASKINSRVAWLGNTKQTINYEGSYFGISSTTVTMPLSTTPITM